MTNSLLLVNAGSSSLKVSLHLAASGERLASAHVDWSGKDASSKFVIRENVQQHSVTFRDAGQALKETLPILLKEFSTDVSLRGIAHRVVHGGDISSSSLIDDELMKKLVKLSTLAPLHNPPSIAAINSARERFPKTPQVAVFDTAFHRTMLPQAAQYAIPRHWTEDWGIKRYGFHGLSHAYCAKRAAELFGQPLQQLRLIICHLGHGCSASAVGGGRSLDTTMGFTPLEGLMMASRCGSIDAGAVLYAQEQHGLSTEEITKALNKESGLLGVSGLSADLRIVLREAENGSEAAQLAISMFCYRIQQAIAALMVPLDGADALVFTAGIGENSAAIRERVCLGLRCFGCSIDKPKNNSVQGDSEITGTDSKIRVFVITTREDLMMLGETKRVLQLGK